MTRRSDPRLRALLARFPELNECRESIENARLHLIRAFRSGGKLLLCGNGGSAADCDHISGELLKGFMQKRPLPARLKAKLPTRLRRTLQGGLPAIPLSSFPALSTAFGNDVDPLLTFAQLTLALGTRGDVLIGLSTSGNAENVRAAFQVARAMGLTSIAFTGRTGGRLHRLADVCLRMPSAETYRVQEYHLPVYHYLCQTLEERFWSTAA